jgi:hypothetical protein
MRGRAKLPHVERARELAFATDPQKQQYPVFDCHQHVMDPDPRGPGLHGTGGLELFSRMHIEPHRLGAGEDIASLGNFFSAAVADQQE